MHYYTFALFAHNVDLIRRRAFQSLPDIDRMKATGVKHYQGKTSNPNRNMNKGTIELKKKQSKRQLIKGVKPNKPIKTNPVTTIEERRVKRQKLQQQQSETSPSLLSMNDPLPILSFCDTDGLPLDHTLLDSAGTLPLLSTDFQSEAVYDEEHDQNLFVLRLHTPVVREQRYTESDTMDHGTSAFPPPPQPPPPLPLSLSLSLQLPVHLQQQQQQNDEPIAVTTETTTATVPADDVHVNHFDFDLLSSMLYADDYYYKQ
jgi:hypothetical protein